jgi:protoheme IX farnesyltransferase
VSTLPDNPPLAAEGSSRLRWREYLELTKPKVSLLIVFTAIVGMVLASPGMVPLPALIFGTLGIALASGSAAAFNHVLDRHIDERMARTRGRPLPTGHLATHQAIVFASLLGLASTLVLWPTVGELTALLTFFSLIGYAIVYTLWLKRATPQNIVIGGAAGAVPPLVGWAAVTGSVSGTAVILFFIVFFWTPPHFWALSLLMKDEYAKVDVPMLPVVRGEAETRRQILLYSVLLYAVTQLPFCAGGFGAAYFVASLVLGIGFIAGAVRLYRRADRRSALRLYLYSLAYLALLFCAMVADKHL